jgi:hypothetical protein
MTLRLIPETLTSTLSLFSNYNGSASLLKISSLVCLEVRRGVSIYEKETWESGSPPLFP